MSVTPYLGVLLHQLGEVVEEAVLRAEEVKLVVPLLLLHELSEELTSVASDKLGSQFDDVQVKGGDGGRVCNELKLWWWFLGHHSLVNHLGLHLLKYDTLYMLCC